jgi:hypothetical protein
MSAQAQAAQSETQVVQVEEEYHHEDKREYKVMDAKLLVPKFNANLLAKAYGDNLSTGSVKSGGGDHPLPAALFFQHAQARVATPIGEPTLAGEYPQMDKNWSFWMVSTNPNSHRLTDHDKCVVESLNHIIRHQNAAAALVEQLLEHNQDIDTDEDTQADMASVFTALQYLTSAKDSSKSALDDFGQKWKHSVTQFELNRRFARSHNPDDESMAAGPGIYDNYKSQVNAYGETSVFKRDCGQLVPKSAAVTKTDWREGSAVRTAKPKKHVSQQQMTVTSAPARPRVKVAEMVGIAHPQLPLSRAVVVIP